MPIVQHLNVYSGIDHGYGKPCKFSSYMGSYGIEQRIQALDLNEEGSNTRQKEDRGLTYNIHICR